MSGTAATARRWEAVPGLWKFLCALAVLFGHNLVTLLAWRPDAPLVGPVYHLVQFFSPIHFFVFSGYIASSALGDAKTGLRGFMAGRATRIYVLVAAAFAWGLGIRLAFLHATGGISAETPWPLGVWAGPVDWRDALMHLSPFGFADHTRFNYATWYLYQELRIVLLFPLFRYVLTRSSSARRWGLLGLLWFAAAALEYKYWSHFPLFRSSPFQTLGYGCAFLAGSLLAKDMERFRRIPSGAAAAILVTGIVVSWLESFHVTIPVSNPPVLLVPTVAGQILVLVGLGRLLPLDLAVPAPLRKATEWSVGIYVVHPPLHVVATWLATTRSDARWLLLEIALALVGGALFHRFVESPSQAWARAARRLVG